MRLIQNNLQRALLTAFTLILLRPNFEARKGELVHSSIVMDTEKGETNDCAAAEPQKYYL